MFVKIPYSDKELRVVDISVGYMGAKTEIRNTPVSRREKMMSIFRDRKAFWIPTSSDIGSIQGPWDKHLSRGARGDFVDDFGIQWVYEPVAGGSIVRGDAPQLLDDVNNWREKVKLPDVDKWEWEEMAEAAKPDMTRPIQVNVNNGFWFERLISFMGFMPAAMALIDDDQIDAIKEMFGALTDLGCKVIRKYCEYFPAIDMFTVHDDWGSQKDPFFSEDVARELFLPYMKQLTSCIHEQGRIAYLHSCGHNFNRTKIFIEGGFDGWTPQTMNDVKTLYKEYGDQMIFGIIPSDPEVPKMDEAGQRQAARDFVDFYSEPGKPIILGTSSSGLTTPAFMEEVYSYSRKVFSK